MSTSSADRGTAARPVGMRSPEAPPQIQAAEEKLPTLAADKGKGLSVEPVPSNRAGFSYRNETLTEDTSWSGEVSVEGALTIAPQTTLTIAPGTVVSFRGSPSGGGAAVLIIQGRIAVNGTGDKPVRFAPDPHAAGNTVWQGIVFLASDKKNILEHCRVEGAETGVDAGFSTVSMKNVSFNRCRTGIRAQDCFVYLWGGGASDCDLGVNLYDSEAEVVGGNFTGNRIGFGVQRSSLYLSGNNISSNDLEALSAEDSKLTIEENILNRNGSGLALASSEGMIAHNRICMNKDYGVALSGSRVKVTANDVSQNGRLGIRVADGRAIAWGNIISANGQYDLYNAGSESFRAISNWWGEAAAPSGAGRIYDRAADPGSGRVFVVPVLQLKPRIAP